MPLQGQYLQHGLSFLLSFSSSLHLIHFQHWCSTRTPLTTDLLVFGIPKSAQFHTYSVIHVQPDFLPSLPSFTTPFQPSFPSRSHVPVIRTHHAWSTLKTPFQSRSHFLSLACSLISHSSGLLVDIVTELNCQAALITAEFSLFFLSAHVLNDWVVLHKKYILSWFPPNL